MYRPWTVGRFGVELEMRGEARSGGVISAWMLRHALQYAGLGDLLTDRDAGYYHSDGSTWDIKTDSSCGWEIASRALSLDLTGNNEELRNVCAALEALEVRVDRTCGTHQHHETPTFDWQDLQRLIALWVRYEPFFFELQPPARRTNAYCHAIYSASWRSPTSSISERALSAIQARRREHFERYARDLGRGALHLGHWWHSGRIEIRLHSGTVNATKILHWAMLMKALIWRVKQQDMPEIELAVPTPKPHGLTTEYVCKQLGLLPSRWKPEVPPEAFALVQWLKARRQQFTPGADERAWATEQAHGSAPLAPEPVLDSERCRAIIGATRGLDRTVIVASGVSNRMLQCPNARRHGHTVCPVHLADYRSRVPMRETRVATATAGAAEEEE